MYPILVTLALILVFGSSAFMSISGLLSIFPNKIFIIVSMGLGMEIGKILTISHLYRSWKENNFLVKTGYIFIVLILTFLTSIEVMGFLSQCHQKGIQGNYLIQSKIDALNKEESVIKNQLYVIDQTLKGLPETYVSRRINERKNSGYHQKQERLLEIINEKANQESQLISDEDNSNSVFAIADVFGLKNSIVITIFIPFLVLILEPLAIGLTIAVNSAWMNQNANLLQKNHLVKKSDLSTKLKILQEKYNLSVSQIAQITGRKKLKTCEGWLRGSIPTPPRALAELQAWVEKEYAKPEG